MIDKDHASRLLANSLNAQALLMLTDVDGVYLDWGTAQSRRLERGTPTELSGHAFAEGSMAPKVKAACDFVNGGGTFAAIGKPEDALGLLQQRGGTIVIS